MKKILAYIAFSFTAITSYATTPLWMRDVQISPDGTEIVFCYKGDIYKVPTRAGQLHSSLHKTLTNVPRYGHRMANR